MSKVLKVFKFEVYKSLKNKFLMVSVFVFLSLFLMVIIVYAYGFPLSNNSVMTQYEKADTVEIYKRERDIYKSYLDFLDGNIATLPDGCLIDANIKDFYKQQYDYYDFLIISNTFESDYLVSNEQGFDAEHQGSYVMLEVLKTLVFVLPLFSILAAFYVAPCEYGGGTAKNLFASKIKRKHIYFGKAAFLCLLNVVIFLIATAYPMFAGMSDKSAQLLLYGNGGYRVQSAFSYLFFPKAVALFLSMIFHSSLSLVIGQLFKKKAWILIVPLLAFAALLLTYFVLDLELGLPIYLMPISIINHSSLDRIISAFIGFSGGWLPLIIAGIVVFVLSTVSVYVGAKRNAKQDF